MGMRINDRFGIPDPLVSESAASKEGRTGMSGDRRQSLPLEMIRLTAIWTAGLGMRVQGGRQKLHGLNATKICLVCLISGR